MQVKLHILCTSDVHGNLLPIHYGTNEKVNTGLATYATAVKQARKKYDHVIVLDNGDLIQGTPLMTHYVNEYSEQKNPMINVMNQIGIDASVIGNHEFNYGMKVLSDAVEQAHFPWLSANILNEQTKQPLFGQPYIVKKFPNGLTIAIVGVTTHYIPHWEQSEHIEGIQFLDAFSTLQSWVNQIHMKEQPDVLIASYHGGFECDLKTGEPTEQITGENQAYKMCEEIKGIDILLTGHQHRQLTEVLHDVLVVQPGHHAQMYGKVDIELQKENGEWVMTNKSAELLTLEGVEPDPVIIREMESLEQSTQQWLDEPIGHIKGDMSISDPFLARTSKHAFIQFIHQVQMDASGVDISVTSLLNNDTKGFGSTVTMRDVESNFMFPNTLIVLELTGKDIKLALEKSAEYFIVNKKNEITVNPAFMYPKPQHYNYDMWEGINYMIHVANEPGSRIKQVFYHGELLEHDQKYSVALNNYRASGGGNYDMFKHKPVVKEIQQNTTELICAYFKKHPIVKAETTKNFIVTL
ncbi:bifunctional metallophosphatase/5'-nucleotidase [Pseudogracilibacillus auburnensis]|uniref:2',3'-cyclic-nucleotide 2'-phosphodiesterase/3'-nucleotidase n=1 Tax=Pseudogracilibacillus auburnensis TaxID=1494959 RepID=A0A2V3W0N3_9BACI|nr:bifunctional UDP-sugar hydrolase/5'-nucleotidase [Pseudogracilibacillus auburnensis]PXW86638.1 2',3'-cyclic-nucleotide 2'-phosphodiesterase/3'-nucleotidase [Pseudogracilibacillus auburnensis]